MRHPMFHPEREKARARPQERQEKEGRDGMKYPYEIVSLVRQKTFSVEARFSRETADRPLQVFEHPFSRFVFTIIQNGKAISANVPISLLEEMAAITRYADMKHMEQKHAPRIASAPQSPAYTVRFRMGNLKGKTPAEVLMEKGEAGKQVLNEEYKFLQANVQKFPKNQELLDAIMDAAKIDPEALKGMAGDAPAGAPAPITLLEPGVRPLTRKKREDGKCLCYEAKAVWDSTRNYPVSVTVTNYYAPVTKKDSGMLNVMLSGKDRSSEVVHEFSMSAAEWLDVVNTMREVRDGYMRMHMADAFRLAEKAEREGRENAKKEKAAQGAERATA